MDIKDQLKDIPIDQVAETLGLGLQKHGDELKAQFVELRGYPLG